MATVTREQKAIEAWTKAMATAENYAIDPHQHIARLVEAGEQMAALLAPKDAAALASPPASDPPGPTVINEDDGDVSIDFDYANDRVVSIRLGADSCGLSALIGRESFSLPLDKVPEPVMALLRTEAKRTTVRQSDPPGLVALRDEMVKVRMHTAHLPEAPRDLLVGLLANIERIADRALALAPPATTGDE